MGVNKHVNKQQPPSSTITTTTHDTHPQCPLTMPTHRRHTTANTHHRQPPGHAGTPSEQCRNAMSAGGRSMGGDDDNMAHQQTSDGDSAVSSPR